MSHTLEGKIEGMALVSELNQREHWAQRHARAKSQQSVVRAHIQSKKHNCIPTTVITLTRIAPRTFDDGNLQACFKHVQDGIAQGLRIDDGSPLVLWVYEQEKGKPKEYAFKYKIEPYAHYVARKAQDFNRALADNFVLSD